jgi:phosphohistidine phosphatase
MRRLILVRHSKAERSAPGNADSDRRLTAQGWADASLVGAYIGHHGLRPDCVLVSSARRAQETWTLIAKAIESAPTKIDDDRIYDASVERLFKLVETVPIDAQTLMVVGHNPGMQDLALTLVATGDIGIREQLNEKFPTSGLAVIDFAFRDWSMLHPKSGRLERFIGPRSLTAGDR